MKLSYSSNKTFKNQDLAFLILIAFVALVRLWLMYFLPLTDDTEARYGEIARLTGQNGFWLMPHVDLKTPFFAKPPLSSWINGTSIYLFGANELAARLPSMLLATLTLWVGWQFAKELRLKYPLFVIAAACISPMFFIVAGAVMTDATQMTVISIGLLSAWKVFSFESSEHQKYTWRWTFWMAVALGALTKGLATWVLLGLPLIVFGLLEKNTWQLFKQLLHFPAMFVSACLFIAWYWVANAENPGFLAYFIIGEHFSRFLIPNWQGDLYGSTQSVPFGTIWVFWLVSILPWVIVFGILMWRQVFSKLRKTTPDTNAAPTTQCLKLFLWCATLAPLVFFTFARSIIAPYTISAVLPFILILGTWFDELSLTLRKRIATAMYIFPLLLLVSSPVIKNQLELQSDKNLLTVYSKLNDKDAEPLLFGAVPSYSSNFYSLENIRYAKNWETIASNYIVLDTSFWDKNIANLPNLDEVMRNHRHVLLHRTHE